MSEISAASLSDQPALSQTQRVLYTFTAPSRTFLDILRSRNVLLPLLLIFIGSYFFTFTAARRVGYDTLAESAIKANPRLEESMQGPQAATIRKQQDIGMHVTVYTFPVFFVIFGAVYALLLWPTFNFALGGRATYGGIFAVVLYSYLIGLLKVVLAGILLWVTEPPEFFIFQDPIGTNPGFYLDQHSGALYALLTSLDLFALWSTVVMGIGCAIVAKVSIRLGIIAAFAWLVLFTLLKVAFSAAFS